MEACRRRTRPILLLHQERGPDSRRMQGIGPALEKCAEAEEGGIVPVRYAGLQLLALEEDGICEYGERSAVRHAYGILRRRFITPEICLSDERTGRGGHDSMEPLAQIGGIKMLFQICNERGSGKPLSLKQKGTCAGRKMGDRQKVYWQRPQLWAAFGTGGVGSRERWKTQGQRRAAYRPGRLMAEVSEEGPADSGENASQAAEHGNKAADKMQDGIMITVPDDTVF